MRSLLYQTELPSGWSEGQDLNLRHEISYAVVLLYAPTGGCSFN
jgi:hypothetical protein